MTHLTSEPADATPLSESEREGLQLPVLTRAELNLVEAENISEAMTWVFGSSRRLRPGSIVQETWLKTLHRRMYGNVWGWAGQYRTTDRNLGVPFWQIRMDMHNIEADAHAWLADTRSERYGDDECAIRFGYRLVIVHPFPNGNGRWSRLASDALIVALGGPRFTWGGTALTEPSRSRRDYIKTLRIADSTGEFGPLIEFARR
ncbi:MAG: mobile mystery protein B [Streptosporangiaceae bacterium]